LTLKHSQKYDMVVFHMLKKLSFGY